MRSIARVGMFRYGSTLSSLRADIPPHKGEGE
ncbi:hypothetical protein BH09PSE1_BH09PSE1_20600 [soil metagenome]